MVRSIPFSVLLSCETVRVFRMIGRQFTTGMTRWTSESDAPSDALWYIDWPWPTYGSILWLNFCFHDGTMRNQYGGTTHLSGGSIGVSYKTNDGCCIKSIGLVRHSLAVGLHDSPMTHLSRWSRSASYYWKLSELNQAKTWSWKSSSFSTHTGTSDPMMTILAKFVNTAAGWGY